MKLNGVSPNQEGAVLLVEPTLPGCPERNEDVVIQDDTLEQESSEAHNQSGLQQCLADLKTGWESMTPRSRLLFLGSGAVSAAAFGYVTVKCGPIPSLRKMIAGLPEYAGPENRAWLRYSAISVLSAAKRAVDLNVHPRRRAGLLASAVLVAASLSPADSNSTQIPSPQAVIISSSNNETRMSL